METVIAIHSDYTLRRASQESLYEVASFVVRQNYQHHASANVPEKDELKVEIQRIYEEELTYFPYAVLYIVLDKKGELIGSIRVMKWNKEVLLPLQYLFGINPLEIIPIPNASFWHIGRLAVSSSHTGLFKQLMLLAITPIFQEACGYMLIECDRKLLKVMNLLGLKTQCMGDSLFYLNSETVPAYASHEGLRGYYERFAPLYGVFVPEEFMK